LLRSDIHTLFDRGLLWIDAAGFVQFGPELEGSEYLPLRGRKLRLPEHPNDHPHPVHLEHHRVHTAGRTS
jgi:putative restriction endonuclease